MITSLYTSSFQKSYTFLYPALCIGKNSAFKPKGTYMSIPELYEFSDYKLILKYVVNNTKPDWVKFKYHNITSNKMFYKDISVPQFDLFVFDMKEFKSDWDLILQGKYSQLSERLKQLLKGYYKEHSPEWKYVDSFINPHAHFKDYARLYDINEDILVSVGELCDKPIEQDEQLILINLNY